MVTEIDADWTEHLANEIHCKYFMLRFRDTHCNNECESHCNNETVEILM